MRLGLRQQTVEQIVGEIGGPTVRDAVLLEQIQPAERLGEHVPRGCVDGPARQQHAAEMPIGNAADVVEGKPIQGHVVGRVAPELVGAGRPGEHIAVRQHHTFGKVGAPGGQTEEGRILGRARPVIMIRWVIAKIVENGNSEAPRRQRTCQRGERWTQRARSDHRGVIEHAAEMNQLIEEPVRSRVRRRGGGHNRYDSSPARSPRTRPEDPHSVRTARWPGPPPAGRWCAGPPESARLQSAALHTIDAGPSRRPGRIPAPARESTRPPGEALRAASGADRQPIEAALRKTAPVFARHARPGKRRRAKPPAGWLRAAGYSERPWPPRLTINPTDPERSASKTNWLYASQG